MWIGYNKVCYSIDNNDVVPWKWLEIIGGNTKMGISVGCSIGYLIDGRWT